MATMNSSNIANPVDTFKFPFSDSRWFPKMLVAFLLGMAGFIIPVIPFFFLYGYYYKICRRIIKDDGIAALPDWDDWGRLFVNGFKYGTASFIYNLPVLICMIAALALMIVPAFIMAGSADAFLENPPDLSNLNYLLLTLFSYPLLGVSSLLSVATGIVTLPALMHLIDNGSFGAAFHFNHWWKILRANAGGFILSYLLLVVCIMLINFASSFLMMTVVLGCLYPILLIFGSVYAGIISSALFARAYRTGVEKLTGNETGMIQKLKPTSTEFLADGAAKPQRKPRKPTVIS
jgi:hypothetical protein